MSIQIIKAGLFDTFQDLGRFGFSHWGINPGGAADPFAYQLANALVGNENNEAVLESHFPAPQISIEKDCLISITGANFSPKISGTAVSLNKPIFVRAGQVLHFDAPIKGSRTYMAVHGGFKLTTWLHSYSTHVKAKAGGFQGRALEKMDKIEFNPSFLKCPSMDCHHPIKELAWSVDDAYFYKNPTELFIVAGRESTEVIDYASAISQEFRVKSNSDRMALNLEATPIQLKQPIEMLSTGIQRGSLQLLPSGNLLVLNVDHQTTGGYPRIGHVISAHWNKLGQLSQGTKIKFKLISQEEAENSYIEYRNELKAIADACLERIQPWIEKR